MQYFQNTIVWLIFAVGTYTFYSIITLLLLPSKSNHWEARATRWQKPIAILISSLPLFGLLGTITGLMETFFTLSINKNADLQTLMANGISDALFTTQFGLSLAVPAIVLNMFLNQKIKQHGLRDTHEKLTPRKA